MGVGVGAESTRKEWSCPRGRGRVRCQPMVLGRLVPRQRMRALARATHMHAHTSTHAYAHAHASAPPPPSTVPRLRSTPLQVYVNQLLGTVAGNVGTVARIKLQGMPFGAQVGGEKARPGVALAPASAPVRGGRRVLMRLARRSLEPRGQTQNPQIPSTPHARPRHDALWHGLDLYLVGGRAPPLPLSMRQPRPPRTGAACAGAVPSVDP